MMRLTTLLLIYCTLIGHTLWGQKVVSDSISAIRYFQLFQNYEYQDTFKSRIYSDSGIYYAKRANSNALMGRAHQFKGWYFQDCSRFKDANTEFYKSLSYLKKARDKQGIADAYGNIGNSYLDMNEFRKSLDYQQLSLIENNKIISSNPNKEELKWAKEGKTFALHNIAAIFQEIGLIDKALEYEYESIGYELEGGNMVGVAISYNTLGGLHNALNHPDSAIYYYKKAIDLYKNYDYPFGLASTLHAYAIMDGTGLSEARRKEMLMESLQIREDLGDADGLIKLLLEIGEAKFDQLSNDSLSNILERVYRVMTENDLEYLSEKYFRLYSKYNSRIGKYDSAYFALENFLELKALSDAKKHTNDLIAQDIRFQWETKSFNDSLSLANQFAEGRLKDQESINRQQNYIYLSVIGLIIVLVTLFFIVQSNKRNRRMNEVLSEKNRLINVQKNMVDEKNKSISDSINYAKRLQTAILPTKDDVHAYLPNGFLFFQPKDVVSGDFHWFDVKNDRIYIAVADCTGHGVPGAMVSVVCSNALNRALNEFGLTAPSQILDKTRELVIKRFEKSGEVVVDGMDISLCSFSMDKSEVIFSGANNPLWIVRSSTGINDETGADSILEEDGVRLLEFKGDKQPVGMYAKMTPFSEHKIKLQKGDCIYLSSDGFADQFGGEHGKKFKYAAFKRLLIDLNEFDMATQQEKLVKSFEEWKGDHEQVDDLCVIGLKID